ncbi:MAG: hypothetical protein JWP58_871 [Hymenobacter sp.]|nr:hypothetical protein [Hymenobacter sp.]
MRFATPTLLLLVSASLSSCKKDAAPQANSSLIGTWRLVSRQCYCAPTPLPNETLTFTATTFMFNRFAPQPGYELFMSGTYQPVAVTLCSLPTASAGLRLSDAVANIGPRDVQFTIQADTLKLDYGSPCDAPRDTYVREQP